MQGRRDQDARLRRRYGDLTTKSSDLLVNRQGYVLIGDDAARAKPLDVPESGGEIAMDDGSLAVAEPLGQGEAYLVRRLAPRRAGAAQGEALERADGRARELARRRAAPSCAAILGAPRKSRAALPSPGAGERLSAYLEAAIDCVIVADASGRIVEFNPAAERTFGYSRKEALGRTMAELIVPPSLRERHIAAFARFVETREGSMLGRRVELTGMRADGSEFPVELALSQVEAEPVLICGALRDISASKQAENHLRELAEEQAALRQVATLVAYESSPDRLVAVVAEQVARVFDVPLVRLIRYEPTAAVVVGGFSESDDRAVPDRFALAARHAGTTGNDPAYRPCRARRGLRADARRRRWCGSSGRDALCGRESDCRRRTRVGRDRASLAAKRIASRRHGGAARRLHGSRRDGARERRVARRARRLGSAGSRARGRAGLVAPSRDACRQGASSDELFAAVTREVADVLDVPVRGPAALRA